jgi:hypothetical protein
MPAVRDSRLEFSDSAATIQSEYPVNHVVGDLDLLFVCRLSNSAPHYTIPAGWITGGWGNKTAASFLRWDFWYRYYESGDTAPLITLGVSAKNNALIQTIHGMLAKNEGTITAITQANPAVVTITSHTFSNGDKIGIHSVGGMVEVNGIEFTVANSTANTFELSGIDSTAYTLYTTGGKTVESPVDNEAIDNSGTTIEAVQSVTPATNNCLILFLNMMNNQGAGQEGIFTLANKSFPCKNYLSFDSDLSFTTAQYYQETAAATFTPVFQHATNNYKGMSTIAIRDDGTGTINEPTIFTENSDYILLAKETNEPTYAADIAGTWDSPLTDFATLDGITTFYYDANNQGATWLTSGLGLYGFGTTWGENNAEGMSAAALGVAWSGFRFTPTASFDVTGKPLILHANSSTKLAIQGLQGDRGMAVIFQSSATDYKAINLNTSAMLDGHHGYIFHPDYGTLLEEGGSLDKTAITGITFFWYPDASTNTYRLFGSIMLLSTATITGGGSSRPVNPADISNMLRQHKKEVADINGDSLLFLRQSIEIGDTGLYSCVNIENKAIEFAGASSKKGVFIPDDMYTFSVNNRTPDICDAANALFTSLTPYNVSFNSACTGANNFDGCTFINVGNFTFDSNPSFVGAALIDCKDIVMGDADLSTFNLSIQNNLSVNYVFNVTTQADLDKLANITFDNCDTPTACIRVTVAGNISLTADDIVFNANCASFHVEYTGTGTLTWTNSGTSNASTEQSTTGTVTFVNPGTGINFTGLVDGSQVVVCTTGTQTELYRDASVTGNASDWDTTGDQGTVDYTIMLAGQKPIRIVGAVVGATKLTTPITQIIDPIYTASAGLTHTTHTSYDPGTKLMTLLLATTLRNFYSAWIEFWIAESAYVNKEFPMEAYGYGTVAFINDAEFVADSHIESYITAGGIKYLDTSDVLTAEWAALQSVGTMTGHTAEIQQVDGAAPVDAGASGAIDEIIKIYGDATHDNFDYRGYMVIKAQPDGYRPSSIDLISQYGTLFAKNYVFALQPELVTGLSTGNPSPTGLTITHLGASPVTWNSKDFSTTLTDTGANTADVIHNWLRYNCSLDATFEAEEPFNYPEFIVKDGDKIKTERGDVIATAGAALKGMRAIDGSGNPLSVFSTMMADDGTLYTVPTTAQASVTGMPTDGAAILLQIVNATALALSSWATITAYSVNDRVLRTTGVGTESTEGLFFVCTTAGSTAVGEPTWDTTPGNTTADGTVVWTTENIQFYSGDPASASYSPTYTEGDDFLSGDTVRIRFAELNVGTTFKIFSQNVVTTSAGWSVVVDEVADPVYATNAIDGSAVTKFTADFTNDEIDLSANSNFTAAEAYAFYCNALTTADGIKQFWGGVVAADAGNYKIITAVLSLYFDNTTVASKRQTDAARIYRDDDAYPVKDPTTSGYGVDVNWKNVVYAYATGSGITAQDKTDIAAAVASESVITGIALDTGTTLPAQIGNIGSATGGALNFPATSDNTGGSIDPASTTKVGTPTNTYSDTEASNGTTHTIAHDTNVIDWVYGFQIGGNRNGATLTIRGFANANNDDLNISAYDFVGSAWEVIGTMEGGQSTSNITLTIPLLSKHSGSATELGNIYIRFNGTGLSASSDLNIDQILIEALNFNQSIGYDKGAVHVDTLSGVAGQEAFVNGVADNPTSSWADAKVIAAAVGINHYHLTNGSEFTLDANSDNYEISGDEYTLHLNAQSINNTSISHALEVDGTFAGLPHILHCGIGALIGAGAKLGYCAIRGKVLSNASGSQWTLHNCWGTSAVNSELDFGAAVATAQSAYVTEYAGALNVSNMDHVDDKLYLSGNGNLIISASSTTGTIYLSGQWIITNNGTTSIIYDSVTTDVSTVKTKTDQLTFGVTNTVNANMTHANEVEITGDGEDATPWNPI